MSTATGSGLPLARLQAQFQAYVLQRAAAHPDEIVGTAGAQVYAEALLLRHAEALGAEYPALRALLGESAFSDLVRRYVLAHPSEHFSIRWAGRHLPEFLRTTPPFAAEAYLAELAALEWQVGEAFDAAAAPALGADVLGRIPPEQWPGLRLRFHPTLRRLDLRFDVVAAWKELNASGQCARLPAPASRTAWIIWRPALDVLYRPLAAGEELALDALRGGLAFGDAAVALIEAGQIAEHDAPAALARWLRGWLDEGLVTGTRPSAGPGEPATVVCDKP